MAAVCETTFLQPDGFLVHKIDDLDFLESTMTLVTCAIKNDNKSFLAKPFAAIDLSKTKHKYAPSKAICDAIIPREVCELHKILWQQNENDAWDSAFLNEKAAAPPTPVIAMPKSGREVAVENTTRNVEKLARSEERHITKALDKMQHTQSNAPAAAEPVQKKVKTVAVAAASKNEGEAMWTAQQFIEFAFTPAFRQQYMK